MVKMTCPPKMVLIPNTNTFSKLLNCFRCVAMVLSLGHHFFPPSSHLRFSGNDSGGSFSITSPGWSWSWSPGMDWMDFSRRDSSIAFFCHVWIFTGSRRMTSNDGFLLVQLPVLVKKGLVNHRKSLEFAGWYRVIPQDLGHMVTLASTPSHSCRTCEFPSSSCTILPCTRLEITVNVVFGNEINSCISCIIDSW